MSTEANSIRPPDEYYFRKMIPQSKWDLLYEIFEGDYHVHLSQFENVIHEEGSKHRLRFMIRIIVVNYQYKYPAQQREWPYPVSGFSRF